MKIVQNLFQQVENFSEKYEHVTMNYIRLDNRHCDFMCIERWLQSYRVSQGCCRSRSPAGMCDSCRDSSAWIAVSVA